MLSQEIRNILNEYKNSPPHEVALKLSSKDLPISFIIQQIEGRQKTKEKLPTWHANENIIFPPRISVEQCSSEQTADYKAALVRGDSLIDLTGGFGVDSCFFAKYNTKVTYVERDYALFEIVKQNNQTLNTSNISSFCGDGLEYLKNTTDLYQTIYIDPARRDQLSGKKIAQLTDCEPNVIEHLDLLLSRSKQILIKTAPLLDIDKSLLDLKFVKEVHVVALNNECKEVLYLIDKTWHLEETIVATNITKTEKEQFTFKRSQETASQVTYSNPLEYIYEPNAAILKAGAFKYLSLAFNLFKIAPNTHLYTNETLHSDFMGRIFKPIAIGKEAEIKTHLVDHKANIITRNYPLTAEQLKTKLKIKDGGNQYIIGFKDSDERPVLALCQRLK